mgnify:CR=1 FL=1
MEEIYLDNSATSPVDPEVAAYIYDTLLNCYGNPSSLHTKGLQAQLRLDKARGQLAKALSCESTSIIFTSGATEANNMALRGAVQARHKRGNKIVTTAYEHASVDHTVDRLAQEYGLQVVKVAPGPDGTISPQALAQAVDEKTILVSFMAVNNETGATIPVEGTAALLRRKNKNLIIHSDGVQAFGKVPLKLGKSEVDLFSLSGHKLHAPKGIGALYVRKGLHLPAYIIGGSQEQGLRPGTESVPLACGLGLAAERMCQEMAQHNQQFLALRERLHQQLKGKDGIYFNSPANAVPYINNLSVVGLRSEILLHFLEQRGIYVSSGSACSKGAKSHVLYAMGLPEERVDSSLRISFGKYTVPSDIDALCQGLLDAQNTLKRART